MFLETLFAILFGILAGTFTGLIPGLHVNLISVVVVSFGFAPLFSVVFILAMAITHTFVDIIPSVYLGAPDPSLALSALPGHKLFLDGKGHKAVYLTTFGGVIATVFACFLAWPFVWVVGLYTFVEPFIGWILLGLLVVLIVREKNISYTLLVFVLAGLLGLTVFEITLNQPLLPLLSGLFGVSLLLLSSSESHVAQNPFVGKTVGWFAGCVATVCGMVAAFLPGFGASQAAIYGSLFVRKSAENFLVLTGGINTVAMFISVLTFWQLGKARNGAVVAISELVVFDWPLTILSLLIMLLVCGVAALITLRLSLVAGRIMSKIHYRGVVWCVIVFLSGMCFWFDSWVGILILSTSTALGIFAQESGVSKHYLLGCLLLPVLLYFL